MRPIILHLSSPNLLLGLVSPGQSMILMKQTKTWLSCCLFLLCLASPPAHAVLSPSASAPFAAGHSFFYASNSSSKFQIISRTLQYLLLEDCTAQSFGKKVFKSKKPELKSQLTTILAVQLAMYVTLEKKTQSTIKWKK